MPQFDSQDHNPCHHCLSNLLDEIQKLAIRYQRTNDLLRNAIHERDQDAERISKLKEEVDRLQEQATTSEVVTKNLTSKFKSSATASSSSTIPPKTPNAIITSSKSRTAGTLLSDLSAGDLLKATFVLDNDDDESGVSPQSQNFRGLQKLSQHRSQQVQLATFELERARANSFQARLHSTDRLRGKALESVMNLYREQQDREREERIRSKQQQQQQQRPSNTTRNLSSSTVNHNNNSISSWGPRAAAAFASSTSSLKKQHLVNPDVLDDSLRRAFAAWLDWCEGQLQTCSQQVQDSTNSDGKNNDDEDEDDVEERRKTANLFKSMLITSQFVQEDDKNNRNLKTANSSSAAFKLAGLTCANELKLCRRLFSNSSAFSSLNGGSTWTVADRARDFFEKMTSIQNEDDDEGEDQRGNRSITMLMMNWPMAI